MTLQIIDGTTEQVIRLTEQEDFTALFLSDLHLGSDHGYLPSDITRRNGAPVLQSKHQKGMEDGLIERLSEVGKVDGLFLLGDLIEGRPDKGVGVNNVGNNLDDQIDWVIQALEPAIVLTKPKFIVGVMGTPNHGDGDRRVLSTLGDRYQKAAVYYGEPSIMVGIGQKIWRLLHQGPTGQNLTTALEGAFTSRAKDAAIKGYPVGDVFAYGHSHKSASMVLADGPVCFICPSQKLNDNFIGSKLKASQPDVGFMLLEQDDDDVSVKMVRTYKTWN